MPTRLLATLAASAIGLAAAAACADASTDEAQAVVRDFMAAVTGTELVRGMPLGDIYLLDAASVERMPHLWTKRLAAEMGDPSTYEFAEGFEVLAQVRGMPPGFRIIEAKRDGSSVEVRVALCYPRGAGETVLQLADSDSGWLVDWIQEAREVPLEVCAD